MIILRMNLITKECGSTSSTELMIMVFEDDEEDEEDIELDFDD
jgi:hypothetical protein